MGSKQQQQIFFKYIQKIQKWCRQNFVTLPLPNVPVALAVCYVSGSRPHYFQPAVCELRLQITTLCRLALCAVLQVTAVCGCRLAPCAVLQVTAVCGCRLAPCAVLQVTAVCGCRLAPCAVLQVTACCCATRGSAETRCLTSGPTCVCRASTLSAGVPPTASLLYPPSVSLYRHAAGVVTVSTSRC